MLAQLVPWLTPLVASGLPDWPAVSPAEAGMDAAAIDAALELAGESGAGAVVVLRDGQLVAERYWGPWTAETAAPIASISKSFTSILVGLALQEGHLASLDVPASEHLVEWDGTPKEAITVEHLLAMTSGIENPMRPGAPLGRSHRDWATALPLAHEPGTRFSYDTATYRLLFPLLEEATGESVQELLRTRLAEPLGLEHTSWRTRRARGVDEPTHLVSSARDLARFGQLLAADGRWEDEPLVDPAYVERATAVASSRNPSYGLLFWLNGRHRLLFPSCPEDAFAAMGAGTARLYVVPSLGLVAVRLGRDIPQSATRRAFDGAFLGALCEAVVDGADGAESGD